ncbi:MAG: YsnF/AvaK domain-containing protein [Caulobacteraceae bacterium]
MTTRTITALYDTKVAAEDAKTRLATAGVASGSIDIHSHNAASGSTAEQGGMLAGLKSMFGSHDDTHAYAEGLTRGHFLLTARVDDANADAAIRVLESTGAVDIDAKQAEWKTAGWKAPTPSTTASAGENDKIEIAEERLVVGKREVERGGVRVRSYVVETPVSEQVTLREENVAIERHAVDRPLAAGEDAFRDRNIEMRETAEEAVVGKQAIVREELTIKKSVGERTEEINDTVRHTEVEVEQLGSSKTAGVSPVAPGKRV